MSRLRRAGAQPVAPVHYRLAGVSVSVSGVDPPLLPHLELVFGPPRSPAPGSHFSCDFHLSADGEGWILVDSDDGPGDAADLLLGLDSPEFPFRQVDHPQSDLALAFGDDPEPLFVLSGGACRIRYGASWQLPAALLLFHRVLRARRDAIFFHAASLGIGGRGLMLVGPKGAGKSTTALALAARGHAFLGDETAGFVPATGELLPVRRPVGIKPGPRARAVSDALERVGRSPERAGIQRVDVESLFDSPEPDPVPLATVFFLSGFTETPQAREITPSRKEVAQLQTVVGSLVNASRLRRVFQLSRMLSGARVVRLSPGEPDATADLVEKEMGWA